MHVEVNMGFFRLLIYLALTNDFIFLDIGYGTPIQQEAFLLVVYARFLLGSR